MQAKAVAGGLLAVIVGVAAFVLWPSEASRVRARVVAAADAVSARPGEGDIDRLARLAGLAKTLSPTSSSRPSPADRPSADASGRGAGHQLSTAGGPQRIELSDSTSPRRGRVACRRDRGRARDVDRGGRRTAAGFDGDVIRIELARTDDGWLITRASPAPALAR